MTTTTPDLLELYKARKFEKIEAILDSAEYTRAEKIAMITSKKNLVYLLCVHARKFYCYFLPIELSIKVLRILGESLGEYVDELKNIVMMDHKDEQEKILRVIVEELSDFQFTDVLTSLLVHSFGWASGIAVVNIFLCSESVIQNILLTKKPIKYEYYISTGQTEEIFLCDNDNDAADTDYVFYKDASLLEIALQKHVSLEIIRILVQIGGKDLLLLSERSLIQGAMIEYNNHNRDETVEILKLFLEVGGKTLVMKEKSWHERDANAGFNILEYLCENGEDYFNMRDVHVAKVMNMLLDTGGKDLVMKNNEKGQTILHYFDYFNYSNCYLHVLEKIKEIGGVDLLSIPDSNGDTVLHTLAKYYPQNKSDAVVDFNRWWKPRHDANVGLNIFEYLCGSGAEFSNIAHIARVMTMLLDAGGKDLVMKKNKKGRTILHYFKYLNRYIFMSVVEKIKEIGGVDLLSITDNNGDTVLHTLAKYYPQNKSDVVVDLEWWKILACDRDLVMMQNKHGKTALHVACENSEINAIKVLVEKGGRDLVWKRDDQMNTALHFLSFRASREKDSKIFQALKHIAEVGGMKLLQSLNKREKETMTPFLIDALEFQFGAENRQAQVNTFEEKAELDKQQWKWIIREKGSEVAVKSLKNKQKSLKKDKDTLNDIIKELQREKNESAVELHGFEFEDYIEKQDIDVQSQQSAMFELDYDFVQQDERVDDSLELMNDKKKKTDVNNLSKTEIKQLQYIQRSLKSKVQEQQVVIENLQDERKQADLEFEIVKTMHEENKSVYEKSLVEVRKLKEVERSQQDDMRDQKEMIQNLQYELYKLEEENQRLRYFNGKEEIPYTDKPSSIQEERQRLIEEFEANIDEVSSIENRVCSLEEENKNLKHAVKEQKQIATEKQKENKSLKDKNQRLIDKIATYSLKRSRDEETEEIDCIEEDEDDIFCHPTKRGKLTQTSSEARASTRTSQVASLENEIEELMKDLECEKSSHMKTLKRFREARKSSKKN